MTKSRAEKIIEQINSTNAKRIAFLIIIGFACYHELLHLKFGSNSCSWLLSDGRYKGDQEWQPYGCMLHHYSKTDTRRCFRYLAFYGKSSHFAFIGDSRIRDLYASFVKHLHQDEDATVAPIPPQTYLIHTENKLKIRVEYIYSLNISAEMVDNFAKWSIDAHPPSVIVAGAGLWSIKGSNASQDAIHDYSLNLTKLMLPIETLFGKKSKVLWALQEPVNREKLTGDFHMVTNEQIDLYNNAAIEVLSTSKAELWWSARLVAQGMVAESPDGMHLAPKPLQHNMQILLNMYCNDYMNFNDGSCCSSAESYTTLQFLTFLMMGIW